MNDPLCPTCGHRISELTAAHAEIARLNADRTALIRALELLQAERDALAQDAARLVEAARLVVPKNYREKMARVTALMQMAEGTRSAVDIAELSTLASAVELYERTTYPLTDDTKRDAARWRYFRDKAWVGTGEDAEVCAYIVFGEVEDVDGLTDAERTTLAEASPKPEEMPSLCERLLDAALSTTTSKGETNDER